LTIIRPVDGTRIAAKLASPTIPRAIIARKVKVTPLIKELPEVNNP
jgi:hypothetical protein